MRRALLLVLAVLLAATPAHAAIDLSWNDCGSAGEETLRFACNTNTGPPFVLVGSFTPSSSVTSFVGITATVDVIGSRNSFPDWWAFGSGACRGANALRLRLDFVDHGLYTCGDPYGLQGMGGFSYDLHAVDPMTARLQIQAATATPMTLDAGTSYYAFALDVSRSGSTGTGACANCNAAVCLMLGNITLWQSNNNAIVDQTPGPRGTAFWHDAYVYIWDDFFTHQSGIGCAPIAPTANRASSWGRIKSLYR